MLHQSKLLLLHHSWTRIKEVRFDKALKKNPSQGFNTPFRFNILAQLINITAHITLHELIRLSKETRKTLRDALAHLESFLIHTIPYRQKWDSMSPLSFGIAAGAKHHFHS